MIYCELQAVESVKMPGDMMYISGMNDDAHVNGEERVTVCRKLEKSGRN